MRAASILAIGEPMIGKSTALKAVHKNHPLATTYFASGDAFRKFRAQHPDHPLTLNEIEPMFQGGSLASDRTTLHVLKEYLATTDNNTKLLLLDGVIRKPSQLQFENLLGIQIVQALYFDPQDIPDNEFLERARMRGRTEETLEVVATRRAVFTRETFPLVEAYSKQGLLTTIPSYQSTDREENKRLVLEDVERALLPYLSEE